MGGLGGLTCVRAVKRERPGIGPLAMIMVVARSGDGGRATVGGGTRKRTGEGLRLHGTPEGIRSTLPAGSALVTTKPSRDRLGTAGHRNGQPPPSGDEFRAPVTGCDPAVMISPHR